MNNKQKKIIREYLSEGRVSKESFDNWNMMPIMERDAIDLVLVVKLPNRFYEFSIPTFINRILWQRTDRVDNQYEEFKKQFYALEKASRTAIDTWEQLVEIITVTYFTTPAMHKQEYFDYKELTDEEKKKFWALLKRFFEKLVGST